MKNIFYLFLLTILLIGCGTEKKEAESGTRSLEIILSDELKNLDVKVIDQSIRESGVRSVRFYIVFNKNISSLLENGVVIFRALSKDNFELVGGFLNNEPLEVNREFEKLPDEKLVNRGFVYTQSIDPMDLNLIKTIKVEIYRK